MHTRDPVEVHHCASEVYTSPKKYDVGESVSANRLKFHGLIQEYSRSEHY